MVDCGAIGGLVIRRRFRRDASLRSLSRRRRKLFALARRDRIGGSHRELFRGARNRLGMAYAAFSKWYFVWLDAGLYQGKAQDKSLTRRRGGAEAQRK